MEFDPSDEYDEQKIVLEVSGEYQDYGVTAYSSPDSEGRTFIEDGEQEIGEVGEPDQFGAPFPVDVVIGEPIYPQEGEIQAIREELGEVFAAQFDGKVDAVYAEIEDADNPLESILSLEASDL